MENFKKKIENLWFHYKVPILILLVIAIIGLDILITTPLDDHYDREIALISPTAFPPEQVDSLKNALSAEYGNINLNTYTVSLGDLNQDEVVLSKLDLDLGNKISSILLIEDLDAFKGATEVVDTSKAVQLKDLPRFAGIGFDSLWFIDRDSQ